MPEPTAALTRLVAVVSTRGGEPPTLGSDVDPGRARDTARDIVSGDAYRVPGRSIPDIVLDWIGDRFADLFRLLSGDGPGGVVGWVVAALLACMAIVFVVRALRERTPSVEADTGEIVYGTETPRDVGLWRREAERLATAGDHRGAVRCFHQAAIAGLISARVADDVPGRSPGEYRRLVADRLGAAGAAMDALTDRFEAAWYGGVTVDAIDVDAVRRDADVVIATAERSPVRT